MITSAPPRTDLGRHFTEGARDIAPLVVALLPLGLAIGAAISASSVPSIAGFLSGPLIFGGAAQVLTIQMLDDGSAPIAIVTAALLVNSRVLAYSASIAPWFRSASLGSRLAVAAPLIDPLFFRCTARFEHGDLDQRGRLAHYAGAATMLLGSWMAIQAVAIWIGTSVPPWMNLQMAAPLAFVGPLANSTRGRPMLVAAAVGGLVAVGGTGLPYQSAIPLAVVGGLVAGAVCAANVTDMHPQEDES
jgi:predicted branched-subunit amino acid permease